MNFIESLWWARGDSNPGPSPCEGMNGKETGLFSLNRAYNAPNFNSTFSSTFAYQSIREYNSDMFNIKGTYNLNTETVTNTFNKQSSSLTSHSLRLEFENVIAYDELRLDFITWIKARVSEGVARDYISNLDRYVSGEVISAPADVFRIMNKAERGKDHLGKGLRNLINYCVENEIVSEEFARKLKRAIKIKPSGVDLYVPTNDEVKEWLKRADRDDVRLAVLLVAFSGLRIKEVVRILETFERSRLKFETLNGVEIAYYELGWRRGSKQANYCFMPAWLGSELKRFDTSYHKVQSYAVKRGIKMKYLRKWFINKMVEFQVPESVVKFMVGHSQGRNIMGLHYLDLFNQAKRYYSMSLSRLQGSVGLDGSLELTKAG
ncbi:hypothetical protein PAP_06165 [Palaeococcus pacificus DY20341]|uniref:Integrase SSV1 C-terminal domain-containing protein n=1 Tax=Palaeococcus pacificus DY20341 TaxID=1343739 RepID=A0A075LYI0_9EURY|nr:integrase [Palaeococcus pacificus]AIF69633.1 hypothetical protein PAP_06165 [Palaeococcus pacificus DY20341]